MVSLKQAIGGLLDIFARKGVNARERRRLHKEGKPIPPNQKLTPAERKQLVDRIAFLIDVVLKGAKLFGGTHHGSHIGFQSLGPGKFMLRSDNPGHGWFVQFLHLGPEPHEPMKGTPVEEELTEQFQQAFHDFLTRPIRGGVEEAQRQVKRVTDFFHDVQHFPEKIAEQLPRFGETPRQFRARRRGERERTLAEEFFDPFGKP